MSRGNKIYALLKADSCAVGLDEINLPPDIQRNYNIELHYFIIRGGTPEALTTPTTNFLHSQQIPVNARVIVKIALGINSITSKTYHGGKH